MMGSSRLSGCIAAKRSASKLPPVHGRHLHRCLLDGAQPAQPARRQTMDGVRKVEVVESLAGHRRRDVAPDHLDITLVTQRVDQFLDEERVPLGFGLDQRQPGARASRRRRNGRPPAGGAASTGIRPSRSRPCPRCRGSSSSRTAGLSPTKGREVSNSAASVKFLVDLLEKVPARRHPTNGSPR